MHHKQLLPLRLDIKRTTWRMAEPQHQLDPQVRAQVLERDDYTCRGCNFRSVPDTKGYTPLEVHNVDHDHRNLDPKNLVAICPLCHQLYHPGTAGITQGGSLVWLPEMSQLDLIHLSRTIFVAIVSGSEFAGSARAIYATLESRGMYVEEVFASGASDPSFFCQALLECNPKEVQQPLIAGLRMLPNPARFTTAINHWVASGYKGLDPATWASLIVPAQ